MEKKDKVNFEVIRYVLENNRRTQKDYIAILFQSMLNEVFYPELEKEQKDLKIIFSRELIFKALLETVKKYSKDKLTSLNVLKMTLKRLLKVLNVVCLLLSSMTCKKAI